MPRVSVIMSTTCRPWLAEAVESIKGQQFQDWELLLINDGFLKNDAILGEYHDRRIRGFNFENQAGKAARCNFGLREAKGEYVAYLDDDDIWYPNHLELLVKALDEHRECNLAYSDLYKSVYLEHEGRRIVVDKRIAVSRDFNRVYMLHYNHALHCSLMHRRADALRVGGYNGCPAGLIDWFLTRKLAIVGDFWHVNQPTGEYFSAVQDSDRISDAIREDRDAFLEIKRQVKAHHPPRPWVIPSVDVVLPVGPEDKDPEGLVRRVMDSLDEYPCFYHVYLHGGVAEMPALSQYPCILQHSLGKWRRDAWTYKRHCKRTSAEFVFLADRNFKPEDWERIQVAIEYLAGTGYEGVKYKEELDTPYNILIRPSDFLRGLRGIPIKIGVINKLRSDSLAFDFHFGKWKDEAFSSPEMIKARKEKSRATDQFLIGDFLRHCISSGKWDEGVKEISKLFKAGFIPDNLVRLGGLLQIKGDYPEAIQAYLGALTHFGIGPDTLAGVDIDIRGVVAAYECLCGAAESFQKLGQNDKAREFFTMASRLKKFHRSSAGLLSCAIGGQAWEFPPICNLEAKSDNGEI